jgi:hypothetical protein
LAALEGLESRTLFATFTVTTVADSGAGSLRQAMLDANATSGQDTIAFAIGTGAQTIAPASALPILTDTAGAIVDGSTQPGVAVGSPVVTIDGTSAGGGTLGFDLSGGNSTIRGLIVQNFDGGQIATGNGTGNQILGNKIANAVGNTSAAISLASTNNRVGAPGDESRNVISGVVDITGDDNIVENNRIGTDADGKVAAANRRGGVMIDSAARAIILNNLISGSAFQGIHTFDATDGTIEGNFIGTNAAGTAALANDDIGIFIELGGHWTIRGNVISGNGSAGISADGDTLTIENNKIGTNAAGDAAIPNGGGTGIRFSGAATITGNVILGGIGGVEGVSGTIQGNKIGTDVTGTTKLGDGGSVSLGGGSPDQANDTLVGGTNPGEGNVIAGGVSLPQFGSGNSILGNSIFSSNGPGIDINTANDGATAPVIGAAEDTHINGELHSKPSQTFRVEFFSSPATGDTSKPQGKTFLGFAEATTDPSGAAAFEATVPTAFAKGEYITATATDPDGNTSNFSDVFVAEAGPADDAPTATLRPQENQPRPTIGANNFAVVVRYHDDTAMDPTSFDNSDIVVTGPNGFSQPATYLPNLVSQVDPQTWDVTYQVPAPGGTVDAGDNGAYGVVVNGGQVLDSGGNAVAAGAAGAAAGTFTFTASDVNTSLGEFGRVGKKQVKLTYAEPDGTQVTVALSGGSGSVTRVEDGRAQINLTTTGRGGGKLTVTAKGGNGRAEIRDINVSGALKSLTAKTADVDGVISSTDAISAISLASANNVSLSTTAPIKSITVAGDVTNSQFWSGVGFGVDGRFGSGNEVSDTPFMQGSIGTISVGGRVVNSLFAAGLDPVDDQLFDHDGIIVGGAASAIRSVKIKGEVDAGTVFAAGKFPKKASIGGVKLDPLSDAHFSMAP